MRPTRAGLPLSLAALTLLVGPLWADEAGEADNKPAVLIIRLPADAELFIGGKKCKQSGKTREFDTPPLPPGKKFSYTVKAVWTEDGQEKTYIARAVVRAGETTRIDVLEPPPKVAEGPKKPDKPPEDKKPPTRPEKEKPVPEPVVKGPALEPAGSFKLEVDGARVSVKSGETRLLTVRVRRDHFKEPVQLRFTGVPTKVAVEKAMLAGDEERAHVQVSAADDAPASETVIGVIASGGKVSVEGSFKLLVVRPEPPKPAPPTPTLAFHAPQTLTLEPGQKKLLPVKVIRSHFKGPVTVKLEGLPPGVEVSEATVPAGKDRVYLAASAADGAEPKECQARLVGTSGKVRQEVPLEIKVGGK